MASDGSAEHYFLLRFFETICQKLCNTFLFTKKKHTHNAFEMSQSVRNEKWNVYVKETTATATVTNEISSFRRMHLLSEISELK